MSRHTIPLFAFILLLALIPTGSAHVPLEPTGNESLGSAYVISEPTKSWVLYGDLRTDLPQYYSFDVEAGTRLYVGLIVPSTGTEQTPLPSMALMGPGLSEAETPEHVQVPAGYGLMVLEGRLPTKASYEPFSPSTLYDLGTLDLPAPASGTYYVSVFSSGEGGRYGLVIGFRESFTLTEWISTPLDLLSVYQWEGQSLVLILAPWAIVSVLGSFLLLRRLRAEGTWGKPFLWLGAVAAFLFIGSGVSVFLQMGIALTVATPGPDVIVTFVLAVVPLVLGVALLRVLVRGGESPPWQGRAKIVSLGILALFAWAGLIVGPALAILAGVVPGTKAEDRSALPQTE